MTDKAKATHSGMLHQSRTLRAKSMMGEPVHARMISLNDSVTPVEVTFTDFERE